MWQMLFVKRLKSEVMFVYPIDNDIKLALVHSSFAKELTALVNAQKDYLGEWLPWVATCDEKSYQDFVKFALHKYADDKGLYTNIFYQGNLVGAVSLNDIHHHLKKCEIGYWLSQDYQGRGIMTRAVRGIMDIAKDVYGMDVAQIRAAEHNLPSRRVAERLGFEYCGVIYNNEVVNGKILNHAVYAYRL